MNQEKSFVIYVHNFHLDLLSNIVSLTERERQMCLLKS